jgi:hypothetical protein
MNGDYVTVAQLAKMKNVHRITIIRLLNEGAFPGAIKVGVEPDNPNTGVWQIPRDVALAWEPRKKGWQHEKE